MALAAVPAPALVIGEALIDVLVEPGGRRREVPGGSPANVALGLGRLGHPVRFATRIGRDRYGDLLLRHLRESGVELTPGSVDGGPTSTATALLDSRGAATYDFDITWAPTPEAVGAVLTGAPAHVHTGSIATALTPGADTVLAAVETARAAATVSYDPNLRPALLGPPERERDRVERLVAASDVVKASDEDLAWLYPGRDAAEVASRWAEGGELRRWWCSRSARGGRGPGGGTAAMRWRRRRYGWWTRWARVTPSRRRWSAGCCGRGCSAARRTSARRCGPRRPGTGCRPP